MIVRFIKELKQEDTTRILEARNKTETISTALNFDFLYKDLNLPERKPTKSDNKAFYLYDKTILSEKLGNVACPLAWLTQTFKEMAYRAFEKIKLNGYLPIFSFRLSLINLDRNFFKKADLLLAIVEKNHYSQLELNLGFFNDPDISKENALHFCNYFYNRKVLYYKIRDILLANQEKLKRYTTKPFVKDLLDLFSVRTILEDLPDFYIPLETKTKKIILDAPNVYDPSLEKALIRFPNNNPSEGKTLGFFSPGRGLIQSIKLILTTKNELMIDFFLFEEPILKDSKALTKEILETINANPIFDQTIEENLNVWLKNIVLLGDFETKLFDKIKTKILISNI